MFRMRTEFSIVLLQFWVLLSHISTAKARLTVFCDSNKWPLECINVDSPFICISHISTGQTGKSICAHVSLPALPKVNYCTNTLVKNYIFKKCNGEKGKCVPFFRTGEISAYCDKTLKYVKMEYTCVSSSSKCPTLALPTHPIVMMASKTNFSDQISPTKTAKTLKINEQKKSNSTLQLNEIPAKTALKPGNESKQNSLTSLPGPTNRAPNSRNKSTTCSLKTTTATTVSPTQENRATTPTQGGRNAGQRIFDIDLPLKCYMMIVLGFFGFLQP